MEFTGGFVPGDFVVLFKRTANNQPVVQSGTGASRGWVRIWWELSGLPTIAIRPMVTPFPPSNRTVPMVRIISWFLVQIPAGQVDSLPMPGKILLVEIHLNGDIAEFVVFPNTLTDANRDRVHGYLAHKWGQTAIIPGGNPYKTTAPLASTKANFVGREGTSAPYLDMRVEFRNGGSLLEVAATTSSFNVYRRYDLKFDQSGGWKLHFSSYPDCSRNGNLGHGRRG